MISLHPGPRIPVHHVALAEFKTSPPVSPSETEFLFPWTRCPLIRSLALANFSDRSFFSKAGKILTGTLYTVEPYAMTRLRRGWHSSNRENQNNPSPWAVPLTPVDSRGVTGPIGNSQKSGRTSGVSSLGNMGCFLQVFRPRGTATMETQRELRDMTSAYPKIRKMII